MEIWINDYQLAKEGREGVSGLVLRPRRNNQERQGIDRAHVEMVGRQNLKHVLTFAVTRGHDTPQEAELFCLDHAYDVPPVGIVHFVVGSGEAQEDRWLLNAAITVSESATIGVSSRHTYTIEGGELTDEDPDPPEE